MTVSVSLKGDEEARTDLLDVARASRRATARASARTAQSARTFIVRQVARRRRIKQKLVRQRIAIKYFGPTLRVVSVGVQWHIPGYRLDPRWVPPDRRRRRNRRSGNPPNHQGVSFKGFPGGVRRTIPGAVLFWSKYRRGQVVGLRGPDGRLHSQGVRIDGDVEYARSIYTRPGGKGMRIFEREYLRQLDLARGVPARQFAGAL